MDFRNAVQFIGDYHHVEVSPSAHLDFGTDITFRSFTSLEVGNDAKLKLGDRVFFNEHCTIRCCKEIEIGKDTMFGDGVRIFDHNHKYSNYHIEKIQFSFAKIIIGKNCWIGANVVILKGVTIGDNVIIGANALIYKDIPANSIVTSQEDLKIIPRKQHQFHAFTLTASDTLEHLDYLVQELPEVAFHIAAKTNVSEYLESFNRYENVNIYTNVHHDDIIEDLLQRADFYLDINRWGEVDNIVERALAIGKSIFAFDTVVHRTAEGVQVFSLEDKENMVMAIRDQLEKIDSGEKE